MAEEDFPQDGVLLDASDDEVRAGFGGGFADGWADGAVEDRHFAGGSFGEFVELLRCSLGFLCGRVFRQYVGDGEVGTEATLHGAGVFEAANGLTAEISGVEDVDAPLAGPFAHRAALGNDQYRDDGFAQDAFGGAGDGETSERGAGFCCESEQVDVVFGDDFLDLTVERSLAEQWGALEF